MSHAANFPFEFDAGMRADAVAELRRCSGTQFDPQVVDVLVAVLAAGTAA